MSSYEGDHGFALTARQISILRLLVRGLTNVEIGNALHLSKYTVSQHVKEMLRRTGAVNRTELAAWALKANMVDF